nr:Crotonase domain containing protein [Haemonchus contortus]
MFSSVLSIWLVNSERRKGPRVENMNKKSFCLMPSCRRLLRLQRISSRLFSSHITPNLAEILHKWPRGQIDLISKGGVARLQLNRPEKSNCLSGEMMFQLGEKLQTLDDFSSCGVLVVEGAGNSFCSGADLGLIDQLCNPSLGEAMFRFMSSSLGMIRSSPLVSVARIHGHCLGGGTEIASMCDLRLAHKDSKFGFMQSRLGIVPSWGGANYLASIVGRSTALRLMTTAPMLNASQAKDIGFVDVVYDSEDDFEEFISSMLKSGANVCRAQKAMLNAVENGKEDDKLGVIRSVWGGTAQRNALTRQLEAVKSKK